MVSVSEPVGSLRCAGLMGSGVVEETTHIEWKEGKNLTVRQVAKKGGGGKKVAGL